MSRQWRMDASGAKKMAVEAIWDDAAHTVVRVHFAGRWTWDELQLAAVQAVSMMQECPVRVDLISDMLDTIYMPPRYVESAQTLISQLQLFPNLQMVVLAGFNRSYASLFDRVKVASVVPFEVAFATSLEMARALIAQSRRGDIAPSGYDRWESSN